MQFFFFKVEFYPCDVSVEEQSCGEYWELHKKVT